MSEGHEPLAHAPRVGEPAEDPLFLEHLAQVAALVKAEHLPEAELEALRALNVKPTDARGLEVLALVRFKRGRYAEAREVYEVLARVNPDDAGVRMALGLIALKMDWAEAAVAELEVAARLPGAPAKVWTYLGYAYVRLGRSALAAEALRKAGDDELAREVGAGRLEEPLGAGASPPAEVPSWQSPVRASAAPGGAESGFFSPEPDALSVDASQPVTAPLEVEGFAAAEDEPPTGTGERAGTSLTNFVLGRLLDVPPTDEFTAPFGSLVGEVLRFAVEGDAHVRAAALLAATGALGVQTARRRSRGRVLEEPLADGAFWHCEGKGELWLAPMGPSTRLLALTLEQDILYVRQAHVVAFDQDVAWEVGRLPGDDLALLQLRGNGRAVLDVGEERFRAFKLPADRSLWVERARLLGWVGRVVAHAVEIPGPTGRLEGRLVACEGEGVLLVSTHGLLDQPTDERAQPRDHGARSPDPGGAAVHR